MPDIDIKSYIDQLRRALTYVPPVPVQNIKALHEKRDFGGIVKLIRSTMNVGVNLTIHWTSGPPPREIPKANAWISLPETMPYYGTPAFKEQKIDIFILKSYRDASTYDEFARTVSHELSHVVLESIHHPLRSEEKAVDLTAMLLGFSYIYRTASHTVRRVDANHQVHSQLGYLSENEMDAACKILVPLPLRSRRVALDILRSSIGLLGLAALCLIGWAIGFASSTDIHKLAMTEQVRIQGEVPWGSNAYMSLIGATAGSSSVTIKYVVTEPLGNLVAFEKRVRALACATNETNIRKGLSYIYEYRGPSGYNIARFNVSACP